MPSVYGCDAAVLREKVWACRHCKQASQLQRNCDVGHVSLGNTALISFISLLTTKSFCARQC